MSLTVSKWVSTEVDVEIDLEDAVDDLSAAEKNQLMAKLAGGGVPFGLGEGDQPRIHTIIERAFLAAKQMPTIPREIADLFWHVHGRALS